MILLGGVGHPSHGGESATRNEDQEQKQHR
jgi:hypothetical protein